MEAVTVGRNLLHWIYLGDGLSHIGAEVQESCGKSQDLNLYLFRFPLRFDQAVM